MSTLIQLAAAAASTTSTVQHAVKYGEAINKGQAVYVSSADGTNMIVSKASNASEATSSKTMGLVLETGPLNYQGTVITEGLLAGTGAAPLNTSTATIGDPVWLGTNGNLIFGLTNKPYAPAHLVFIGIVTRVSATVGEIFVKVQNGFELDELHDVDLITNAPTDGQVLSYNAVAELWVPTSIPGATPSGTQLLTGGASWSGTGMIFNVSALTYTIDGDYYSSIAQNITLATGDPSNPRFDAIVVDATGTVSVITGTPSANPIVPSIPGTQVLVQYVLVAAGAVTPSITNELVYTDGSTPNWTPGSNLLTAFNPLSTTPTPFLGTECTYITALSASTSRFLKYTKPSGNILKSSFPFLSFRIQVLPGSSGRGMNVRLYNGLTYINTVNAASWGYSSTAVGVWQLVVIPLSAFGNAFTTVTEVRFLPQGAVVSATPFAFDDIKFQSGYGPQTNTATIDILDSGTVIGSTAKLNFVDGTNTTVVVTQDVPNNKIDVQIDATGSFGKFGIADANGLYTYYSTLQSAITAAVAGQTIEMFTDVIESTSASPNLKPGVVINGNGHTYTHTSTTGDTFTLTTTGQYKIINLNIKRTVTTPTAAVIFGNTTAPFYQEYNMIFNGSYVEYTWTTSTGAISLCASTNACTYHFEGLNAVSNGSGYMLPCYGTIRNCRLENTGTGGCINTTNAGSTNTLENLHLKTVSGNCLFMTYGSNSIRNSTAITTSGNAISGQSGASAYDCYAVSSTGKSFSGVIAYGCTGQTDTGNAYYQCATYNCSGRSTTGYTVVPFFSAAKNFNGSFYSSGASVGYSTTYCIDFYNSSVITDSTSNAIVSGNAYGTTPTYINNYIQVGAAAAYCISTPGINTRYSGNQFLGSTTPVNPTTIQVITNTSDNQGNLLI